MSLLRRPVVPLVLSLLVVPIVLGGVLDDISEEEMSSFVLKPGAVLGGIKFIEPHRSFPSTSSAVFLSIEERGKGGGEINLPALGDRYLRKEKKESAAPYTFGMAPRFPRRHATHEADYLPVRKSPRLPPLQVKPLQSKLAARKQADVDSIGAFQPRPPQEKRPKLPQIRRGLGPQIEVPKDNSGELEIQGHQVGKYRGLRSRVERVDDDTHPHGGTPRADMWPSQTQHLGTFSAESDFDDDFDDDDFLDSEGLGTSGGSEDLAAKLVSDELNAVPEKELGSGSFGSVWKAQMPDGSFRAVKVLTVKRKEDWAYIKWSECDVPQAISASGSTAAGHAMECFESRLISPLEEGDIDETEELESTGLFVLEYVEGESLGMILRELQDSERTMNPDRAVHITSQIMSVVKLIGEKGINIIGKPGAMEPPIEESDRRDYEEDEVDVFHPDFTDSPIRKKVRYQDVEVKKRRITHHDLKPDNIMIGTNDFVKIIDFGAAGECNAYSSENDVLPASPLYMDPLTTYFKKRDSDLPDFREWAGSCWSYDEFAAGATFFEMLNNEALMRRDLISVFSRPKAFNEISRSAYEAAFNLKRRFKEQNHNVAKEPYLDYVRIIQRMVSLHIDDRRSPSAIVDMLRDIKVGSTTLPRLPLH